MTHSPPGEWQEHAHALWLAEQLADLRIAACNALNLPLATPVSDLAAALNRHDLDTHEDTP